MTLLLGFLVDLIITKLESSGNSDKIGDLQIKAPRSKLPAFISCLKKRIKLKWRRMPACAGAPAKLTRGVA